MTKRQNRYALPQTVASLLETEAHVARLTAHASRLLQMQQSLEAALPRQLTRLVRVANLRLGKVIIHAANGAVAAKVRQVLPGLAEKLRQTGIEINEIEVKVQPIHPSIPKTEVHSTVVLGDRAKQGLTTLARNLPDNALLKTALERLLQKNR